MTGREALTEFSYRLNTLEAHACGIRRILATLDGLKEVFLNSTAGKYGNVDKVGELITLYSDLQDTCASDIENLRAAHADALRLVERMDPRHSEILSLVYIAGKSVAEAAEVMKVDKSSAYRRHDVALALLDSLLWPSNS